MSAEVLNEMQAEKALLREHAEALARALRLVCSYTGGDTCWCDLPMMIPYRGHDSGCVAARFALASYEEYKERG